MVQGIQETHADEHNKLSLRREGAHIDHLPVVIKLKLPYKWKTKQNLQKTYGTEHNLARRRKHGNNTDLTNNVSNPSQSIRKT
jgi:hypothetical protein